MALSTFQSMAGQVLLRCPLAGLLLARSWISQSFRRVMERRAWTWLTGNGHFLAPAAYSTGTIAVVYGSTTVTGTDTVWTSAMIGRQLVVSSEPIYTITAVDVALQTLTLERSWNGESNADATYTILKCYYEVPTNFHAFLNIWDSQNGWTLNHLATQAELHGMDTQRTNRGDSYCAAFFDYYVPTGETVAVPRYELWPHPTTQKVFPYRYETRHADLEDSGATLPRFLHGDVLVEMALEQAAMWPGPSTEKPNPYFNRDLAKMHRDRAEQLIMELERQDDEVGNQNVTYDDSDFTYVGDANWIQRHAL